LAQIVGHFHWGYCSGDLAKRFRDYETMLCRVLYNFALLQEFSPSPVGIEGKL
jgi:hypothetical protein